jgi:hypothetical protein
MVSQRTSGEVSQILIGWSKNFDQNFFSERLQIIKKRRRQSINQSACIKYKDAIQSFERQLGKAL